MITKTIERHKSGVYKITNLINGKTYIGSSINIYNRYHAHKTKLKSKKHHCKHLESSYHKYGFDNFLFEVLEYCSLLDVLDREQYYVDLLNPEYNKREIVSVNIGLEVTQETRNKISNTLKERYIKKEIKAYNQIHKFRVVEQYDLDGNLLESYTNAKVVEIKYGFTSGNISRICTNENNSILGGFQWKYRDSSKVISTYKKTKKGKAIRVHHLVRKEERVFNSIKEFCKLINKPLSTIIKYKGKIYLDKYKIEVI